MRRRHRRAPLALLPALALVAGLAACSDDGDDADTSPTTTSPTTEATDPGEEDDGGDETTTTAPPEEVDASSTTAAASEAPPPAEVDAAYVEDIAGGLLERWQAALAAVRTEGSVTPTVRALLGTTFVPTAANAVATEIERGGGPAFVVAEPRAATIDGTEVVASVEGCVEASASIDVSGLLATPPPADATWYFRLEAVDPAANGTPWLFAYIGPSVDGEPPEVGCS